jgi:hypothetical protein
MSDIVEVMARAMCKRFFKYPDQHWEGRFMDEAISTVAALDAHGFAVVPKEPTEAMIDAAFEATGAGANEIEAERAQYRRAFQLMLAASQLKGEGA